MSQQEVIDFLKAHPKQWFTAKQIAERNGSNTHNNSRVLKVLRDHNEVMFKRRQPSHDEHTYLYKYKA